MGSNAHFSYRWSRWQASKRQQDVGHDDRALPVGHFFRAPLSTLLVAIAYYAGTKIGFMFTPPPNAYSNFLAPQRNPARRFPFNTGSDVVGSSLGGTSGSSPRSATRRYSSLD